MNLTNKTVIFIIFFFLCIFNRKNAAQSGGVITVTFQNESIRQLSKTYLHNPDYWSTILFYNNLASENDLKRGMKLKIPVGLVFDTQKKIAECKNIISKANKNGAKIFTPVLILEAQNIFNSALLFKKKEKWKLAYDKINDAIKLADKSLAKSKSLRINAADAAFSFTKGNVQKRKPKSKLWNKANLYDKLFEADRARTLSNSLAEITFIDLSRIRLNENSQAVIQHSRVDVLKNKTDTKVKLIKGDAFAYLLNTPKKKFDVDIPGVTIAINSKHFWVEKDPSATKIANYEGEIKLAAQNVAVIVRKNQGSIIPDGGKPSEPKNLLSPPGLIAPKNMDRLFNGNSRFSWNKVKGAKKYWFELALDASFKTIYYSDKNVLSNNIEISNLKPYVYYWHVCTIGKFGFPGNFSKANYLMISKDLTKPFLAIDYPQNMAVVKTDTIFVIGESEPGLKIYVNGKLTAVNKNGKFSTKVDLKDGKNDINIYSVDASMNKTQFTRTVFYEAASKIVNHIKNKNYLKNKKLFITNSPNFSITGTTRQFAKIECEYNGITKTIYSDANGNYNLDFKLNSKVKNLKIRIITLAGYFLDLNYKILLDMDKPKINFDENIPKITNKKVIELSGKVTGADSLFINSKIIKIKNNKFVKNLSLNEGSNKLEIIAKDFAGNIIRENIYIVRDSTPPKLIMWKLIRQKNRNKYLLRVKVSDLSELKKTALVTIDISGVRQKIFLLLDKNNNEYLKEIFVKDKNTGIQIKSVLLEDYLGNRKNYKIN